MKANIIFDDKKRKLVVVTTISSWDEPPRIRHQVTNKLCEHYNVLYVQTWPNEKASVRKINSSLITLSVGRYIRGLDRIYYIFPVFEYVYKKIIVKKISMIVKMLGYKSASILNFNYNFPEVMDKKIFNDRIYICNDDFVNAIGVSSDFIRNYKNKRQINVLKKSTKAFAVSIPLVEQLYKYNKSAELLLPGVDYFEVPEAVDEPGKMQKEYKNNIAFMGYIDYRLNIDILNDLAKNGRYNIYLIGPVYSDELKLALKDYNNIIYIPSLYGKELIKKLCEMNALIIPYKSSGIQASVTNAISAPNKYYIYLSSGRPIIISGMPNFITTQNKFVYRVNQDKEFSEIIDQAIRDDTKELRRSRVREAKINSWDNRINAIMNCLP
jgi:hypothetical protein